MLVTLKIGLKGSDSFDQEEALLHTGPVIYDVKLKGLRYYPVKIRLAKLLLSINNRKVV